MSNLYDQTGYCEIKNSGVYRQYSSHVDCISTTSIAQAIEFYETYKASYIVGIVSYDFGLKQLGVDSRHNNFMPSMQLFAYRSYEEVTVEDGNRITFEQIVKPDIHELRAKFSNAISHLKRGDSYVMNLSADFTAQTAVTEETIWKHVSSFTAKHSGYLKAENLTLYSASPETFIKIRGGIITTQPMKGTVARSSTEATDKHNFNQLLTSEKEKAELAMVTDLLRNDLAMVATTGSIQVVRGRFIEGNQNVWSAQSHIQAELLGSLSPLEALLTMMPAGSISGMPKKRAVELIDLIEDRARNYYTGVLFTLDPDGSLDSSVIIRTLIQHEGGVRLGVGAGVTVESIPAQEAQEVIDKGYVLGEIGMMK